MTRPSALRVARRLGSADPRLIGPLALVVLVSVSTVFFRLGARGLWGDEVWQVSWSQQQDWVETFLRFRAPPDLPLSFLLTKAAVAFGEDPFVARLPSAVLAAIGPIMAFVLARRVFGIPSGIVAGLLLAVAPFHVWYAQDARPYAALSAYALVSLVLFWRLLERPTVVVTLGYAAAAILGLYNHMFGALPIAVEYAFFVGWAAFVWFRTPPAIRQERRIRVIRAAVGLVFAGAVAFLATIPLHDGVLAYIGIGAPGAVEARPFVPNMAFLEQLLGSFGAGTGALFWAVLALFALGAGAALRRGHPFAGLALAWLILPVAALWVAQPQHIFIPRYFLFMQPVYLMMAAHGLVVAARALAAAVRSGSEPVARASVAAATAVALLVFAAPTAASYWTSRGTDWTAMCRYLEARVSAGDVIVGNAYHQGVMGWCLRRSPAAVAPTGSFDIGDLATSGRGARYVYVPFEEPGPALAATGYAFVPPETWSGVQSGGPATNFQFPVAEHGASLYRHEPGRPPRAIDFLEIDGQSVSANWPDYAQLGAGGRYQVRLRLTARAPRDLEVVYLDSVDRDIEVLLDGRPAGRLVGGTAEGGWTTAAIPVPASLGDVLVVEFRNPGSELVAFSHVELRYRAVD